MTPNEGVLWEVNKKKKIWVEVVSIWLIRVTFSFRVIWKTRWGTYFFLLEDALVLGDDLVVEGEGCFFGRVTWWGWGGLGIMFLRTTLFWTYRISKSPYEEEPKLPLCLLLYYRAYWRATSSWHLWFLVWVILEWLDAGTWGSYLEYQWAHWWLFSNDT